METVKFEQYLQEELKYYDEHPEEDDPIECHTNGVAGVECENKWQSANRPPLQLYFVTFALFGVWRVYN